MTLVQKEVQKVYMWKEPYTDYSAMQWPCPDGFHVPTKDECVALINAWVTLGAWTQSSWTPLQTYLKMPFAGMRNPNSPGGVLAQGTALCFWSSIWYSSVSAYWLYAGSAEINPQAWGSRRQWSSIRPFKNDAVQPDDTWTKLYWTSIESWGIFWSSTDWLISLSSDWQTWITIADKNLWATQVYNSWDTLSEANCGKYYQWGNNYGFPRTWSVTTSTAQVNAWTYWPWNYYSSSTYIVPSNSSYGWDSSNNNDLRWWETWVITWWWDILIRPTEQKREPWPNTKAYYPLVSDINDYSWNGNNLTASSTLAFWTYWTVTAYTAWANPFLYSTSAKLPTGNVTETISLWAYCTTLPSSYTNYLICHWNDTSWWYATLYVNRNKMPGCLCGINIVWTQTISANTWYLYTMTIQNNTVSFYLNWTLINSSTYSTINIWATSSTYPFRIGRERSGGNTYNWRWGISEVIIEDKAWSADDIQKYFNSNKEKYWIS